MVDKAFTAFNDAPSILFEAIDSLSVLDNINQSAGQAVSALDNNSRS